MGRLQRFEQEARAAAALNHPNILALYDIGRSETGPYLVTELLEGETLRTTLDRGAMPTRKAIEQAVQIARGLAAAHDKGIVHRDLKPENVFITSDGQPRSSISVSRSWWIHSQRSPAAACWPQRPWQRRPASCCTRC